MQNWSFRVWGCRGGISVDGEAYARYGGLTTCLELEYEGARIFIDAGTGFAHAGRVLAHDGRPTLLFVTHLHADHIKGFPFFGPLFTPGWDLQIVGPMREGLSPFEFMCQIHRPPLFPAPVQQLTQARVLGRSVAMEGSEDFHGVRIAWCEVWHPGGCSAVSLHIGDRRIVFSGDLELERTDRGALAAFCRDADLLIVDAQYDEQEYPQHLGWGHSTNLQAARFAAEAGVGRLLLSHHDPRHDDATIDRMVADAREVFPATDAAACGMTITDADLGSR